jgi:hypothetical protein
MRAVRSRRTDVDSRWLERGAAVVEFALILPLLMGMLLGTLTAGLAYNRNQSMNNAARESSRYGAVLPVESDLDAWLDRVADVAIESTTGDVVASVPGQRVCVAYVYPDGTDTEDRTKSIVELAGFRTVTVGGTCFTDSRPDHERRVQISLERTSEVEAVLYSRNLTLTAESIALFERGNG